MSQGRVIACDVVWAETAASFPSAKDARSALSRLGVEFVAMNEESTTSAGRAWKEYRSRGGKRERVVADFLIGAHASEQAEQLLSRDRGFYRHYFRGLTVVDPST
jgi:predicted nucleic acid-binding protein